MIGRKPGRRAGRGATALALAALAALGGVACSFGSYGDRGDRITDEVPKFITPGKTRKVEVLAQLGEPDSTAISGPTEVLFYRSVRGWYLGVVGRIVREDLVVRTENGIVTAAEARRIGDSTGVLLPPFGDGR